METFFLFFLFVVAAIIWEFLVDFFYFNFSRGFEDISSLNVPYYKGIKKEEIKDWDTLKVSYRK